MAGLTTIGISDIKDTSEVREIQESLSPEKEILEAQTHDFNAIDTTDTTNTENDLHIPEPRDEADSTGMSIAHIPSNSMTEHLQETGDERVTTWSPHQMLTPGFRNRT